MPKRGQITVFLILAIVLIIAFGLVYYVNKAGVKKESTESVKKETTKEAESADIVKVYVESCIKKVSEDALFDKIGVHGGYIGTTGYPATSFLGNTVPYYLEGITINGVTAYDVHYPSLETINQKLSEYILVEFENCFNTKIFDDIGIEITKPTSTSDVNIDVGLNEEDVSVSLKYPLTVKIEDAETKLESFRVTLPIRLKALYDSAVVLVGKASTQPIYDISPDCVDFYDKNKLTNVYLKPSDTGADKIIQFIDYSTYFNYYVKSYIFQFAVKNINIDGGCAAP